MNSKHSLVLLLSLSFLSQSALAQEGMWLPQTFLPKTKITHEFKSKIDPKKFFLGQETSFVDAFVQFRKNGRFFCSGSFISSKGLIATNHHCAEYAILADQARSQAGYWSKSQSEELKAPGVVVSITEDIIEVTKEILTAHQASGSGTASKATVAAIIKKAAGPWIKDGTFNEIDPSAWNVRYLYPAYDLGNGLKAELVSLYQNNSFMVYIYRSFEDVRLVAAPPSSIGTFGGDSENWRWPRHTGDYTIFRAYANETTPLSPKKYLKISSANLKKGDQSLVVGYPGTTNHFVTLNEFLDLRESSVQPAKYALKNIMDVLKPIVASGAQYEMRFGNDLQSAANYALNYNYKDNSYQNIRPEVLNQVKVQEQELAAYAATHSEFETYLNDIKVMEAKLAKTKSLRTIEAYLGNGLLRTKAYERYLALNAISKLSGAEREQAIKELTEDYAADAPFEKTVQDLAKAQLKNSNPVVAAHLSNLIQSTGLNIESLGGGILLSQTAFLSALQGDLDAYQNDSFVWFFNRLANQVSQQRAVLAQDLKELAQAKSHLIGGYLKLAQVKKKPFSIFPDANSTLRYSFGKVAPLKGKDFTTGDEVLALNQDGNSEFDVPADLEKVLKNHDYGQWANRRGELPVCFVTTNHITGGNSGSAVVDTKGNLIGLAFDGNGYDYALTDNVFDIEQARTIVVDIRYVLFTIQKIGHVDYLISELEFAK